MEREKQVLEGQVKKALSEDGMPIEASSFSTRADCDAALRAPWYLLNFIPVPDAMEPEVEEFKRAYAGWADTYHLLGPQMREDACSCLLASMEGLRSAGYTALYSIYTSEDNYTVAVILFGPTDNAHFRELAYLNAPRHMAGLTQAIREQS